ncbi:MAG: rhomboid family intramembrane serine protease [Treponemataceae bacterium]|nr:rhomboid family intramembrane serine protease [Treponemataceae bacterium]
MGGRKSFKLRYDAAFTLTFCIVSFLVLILSQTVLKNLNLVQKIFSLPGTLSKSVSVDASQIIQTESVFDFKNPFHYVRLILYIFGSKDVLQFLISFAFILPLGTQMEERYGNAAIGVMILITTLVTGVLNACLIPATLCGADAIVFMLILLGAITSLSKNELPISALMIFALYMGCEFYFNGAINNAKLVAIFARLAGALCGSMFGFLTAPKTRRASSTKSAGNSSASNSNDDYNTERTAAARKSFMERIKQERQKKKFDDETTVIGSVEI